MSFGKSDTFRPHGGSVFFSTKTNPENWSRTPTSTDRVPTTVAAPSAAPAWWGCRHNAKNTLVKNYLYFAEKWGVDVLAETTVKDIHPLPPQQSDGARYEVCCYRTTAWPIKLKERIRARLIFCAQKYFRAWTRRTTIILTMQTADNLMRVRLGRHMFTLFRKKSCLRTG